MRDVLKLNIFTHRVLFQVFDKLISVLIINIYPVFHVSKTLRCEFRFSNYCVKHHFSFYSQKTRVNCSSLLFYLKQHHVVSYCIVQNSSGITSAH